MPLICRIFVFGLHFEFLRVLNRFLSGTGMHPRIVHVVAALSWSDGPLSGSVVERPRSIFADFRLYGLVVVGCRFDTE